MFLNLFTKECRQILSSLVFYIYIVLFVLFMASQMNEVDVVSMPEPGQQDYGYTYTSDKTAIMEGTLTDLFMDIDNSTFDTYPWGFLKTVVPDKDDLKKLTDILERCTWCSMDELADMEYEWVQNAGGETDQGFTIPLADDLDYDTFLAEMAKVCDIVGKGSSYERSAFETTTRIPMTYDQAMTSYNEICDIDHVTDSYMRLFCDYASIMLGFLPIFVMVTRCARDKRSHVTQVIYAKSVSSAKIVLSRYLSNLVMVLIPVLILAFAMELPYIYQAHTLGVVPHYLSFLKYTVIWLVPITAWIMALSYLLAELTNGVIAVIVPALYVFLSDLASSILVGNWGLKLMPRWNTFGNADYFFQHRNELYINRLFYAGLAILAVILTMIIYSIKRKGGLRRHGKSN